MDPYERNKLSDAFKEENFAEEDVIIREGAQGDRFYVIVEGSAVATKIFGQGSKPVQVMEYKPGQYFGERALLTHEARAATITATSQVKCLTIGKESFERMLGPLEEILKRNMDAYQKHNQ